MPLQLITLVLLLVLTAGCRSTPTTPESLFFQRHPNLRIHYTEFYETSPEAIARAIDDKQMLALALLHGLQDGHTNYADAAKSTDVIEKRVLTSLDGERDFLKRIKHDFDPNTDALFWYSYHDGADHEQGWAILRRGDIYRRYWVGSSFKEPGTRP